MNRQVSFWLACMIAVTIAGCGPRLTPTPTPDPVPVEKPDSTIPAGSFRLSLRDPQLLVVEIPGTAGSARKLQVGLGDTPDKLSGGGIQIKHKVVVRLSAAMGHNKESGSDVITLQIECTTEPDTGVKTKVGPFEFPAPDGKSLEDLYSFDPKLGLFKVGTPARLGTITGNETVHPITLHVIEE